MGIEGRGARGFTLLELMTVVAIVAILATLAYASLRTVPRSAKLSSAAMELTGELSAARSQAYGRDARVAVLLYASHSGGLRYWMVLDPWLTLDDAMAANTGWSSPSELVPPAPSAPPGSIFRVLDSGTLDAVLSLNAGGYKTVVGGARDPRCVALGADSFVLATGTGGGSGYFPPPYCMVPDDQGCTFCTAASGGALRGAILFEPEGRIRLLDGEGQESPAGAGSLTLTAAELPSSKGIAVALTSSGLVHTFRGGR